MAIYKIFPYKDTTLYSFYPTMNTGIDAISQVSNLNVSLDMNPQITRYLTQYPQDLILDVINNKIKNANWDVEFKSFIAQAQGINENSTIELYPIAQNWFNGTGAYLDIPITTNGASWYSSDFENSTTWSISGSDINGNDFTSSYNATYVGQGGGNWYITSSLNVPYYNTQSFDLRSDKDLKINVKNIVTDWYSGSLPNYGFIIKWEDNIEFNTNPQIQPILQFFSVDTNTIYPPELYFKWNDFSTVLTGSATASIVTNTNIVSSLADNPGTFYPESVNRFRVNVAPKYPIKTWSTESIFTSVNYLPTSSYYSIKDLDTNEFVVDFDPIYTKISADSRGNYFDIYMNGLQPERYYSILIKTTIDNSTLILNDNYVFKVVNG